MISADKKVMALRHSVPCEMLCSTREERLQLKNLIEAEDACEAAEEIWFKTEYEIAETTATTLPGAIAKLSLAAECFRDDPQSVYEQTVISAFDISNSWCARLPM